MPIRLRKLFRLTARESRDLFRAQGALLMAQWRLWRQPLGEMAMREPGREVPATGDPVRALALSKAIRRAANHGVFRPFCLVQSLALRSLLEGEEIRGSTIRVGVRRTAGEFRAHAWIRWGDAVLGDDPSHVAEFIEVNDLRVLESR